MSHDDVSITVETEELGVTVADVPDVEVVVASTPDIFLDVVPKSDELRISAESKLIELSVETPDVEVIVDPYPDVILIAAGNLGRPGIDGEDGTDGEPGPPGPPGDQFTYIHDQASLSDIWVVTHNKNYYPSVSVVDTGGSVVFPNVQYDSENQLTISFEAATSGKAYLN